MIFLVGKSYSGKSTLCKHITQKYKVKCTRILGTLEKFPELNVLVISGFDFRQVVIKLEREETKAKDLKTDFVITNNDDVDALHEKFDKIIEILTFQQGLD